jgi:hypothetical protein
MTDFDFFPFVSSEKLELPTPLTFRVAGSAQNEIVLDLQGDTDFIVKRYLSGTAMDLVKEWLNRLETPKAVAIDPGSFEVLEHKEPTRALIKDIKVENGFYVVKVEEENAGLFVYLFDEKFVPISNGKNKLGFFSPVRSQTKHFDFPPGPIQNKIEALEGVRKTISPEVYNALML